jgi:glycine/D-amino acid oxidase-like deaminating enzyme
MSSPGKCLVIGDGIMGLGSAIGATKIHDKVITFGGVLTSCAASYGISRILRTDYSNLKFSQYAMRSFELWMASYSQFVNKCGRYLVYRPDYVHILDDIDHTRLERGKAKCIRVTEEQVIQAFGSKGNFKHIFGEDAIYVYSPDDCAVDWKGFMDSRRETARGNAVEIREEEVQDLDIGLGRVTRIATKTISYNVNQDDTVILASGGWTSAQMGRWGIPELAESQQPTTVVIISFDIELSAEELAKVQGISIFSVIGCSKSHANSSGISR